MKAHTQTTKGYILAELLLYFSIHYSPFQKQPLSIRCAYMQSTRKPSKWLLSILASLHHIVIFKKETKNVLDCWMFENFFISVPFLLDVLCLHFAFNVKLVAGYKGDKDPWVYKWFRSTLSALHKEKVRKRNVGDP